MVSEPFLRRFNLEGFVPGEKTSTGKDDIEWLQLDALIQGWILSTINDEVSDLIISSTTSAADLWKAIHNLFHDNKAARAMQLEHQFYNTVKGTSTITTYCQTLRNIADWLDDVDAPVTENQLVLQTLRGLPDDLGKQASFLQFQKPPPTFMETRSALLLLEQQNRPLIIAGEGGSALAATISGPQGFGGGASRVQGFGGGGQSQGSGGGRGQTAGGRGGRLCPHSLSLVHSLLQILSSIASLQFAQKNTTILKSTIARSRQTLDAGDIKKLKSKKSLPVTIRLDTKVRVKVGSLKTNKVGDRVTCGGIRVSECSIGKVAGESHRPGRELPS
ncbi:unnamed protein product [Cuscuta campestris]|uniref:Retrotransposon gag domain-containing protein n=1 Tax=Cuscuta campestris TaxID=132261 RepID=A0A484LIE2_9ASTE|nr:unnamed protein product [Cuscuta campestris]